VSHAAVYSEVLFWFVVVLTLLLVMFIGVVVRTPLGAACRELPLGPGPAPHAGSMSYAADMTGRAGVHRQARRHGAHRAGLSAGRERRSAGRAGIALECTKMPPGPPVRRSAGPAPGPGPGLNDPRAPAGVTAAGVTRASPGRRIMKPLPLTRVQEGT
jgi:hypothetical protein